MTRTSLDRSPTAKTDRAVTYTERVSLVVTAEQHAALGEYGATIGRGRGAVLREAALVDIGRADLSLETGMPRDPGAHLDREASPSGFRRGLHVVVLLTLIQRRALELAALERGVRLSDVLRLPGLAAAGAPELPELPPWSRTPAGPAKKKRASRNKHRPA